MIKRLLSLTVLLFIGISVFCQNEELLVNIQNDQLLSYGGCNLLNFNGTDYLVGVSAVEAGNKKISTLTRIGKVKAEREISTFINGSGITSRTESYLKEELTTVNDSSHVQTTDTFVEYIREDSEGFVKKMQPAGFWYSDDRSVFYYAIYTKVNL
ncbi:MAG: hypothetical protein ACLFPE_12120 [Bacteroidales bacterium]